MRVSKEWVPKKSEIGISASSDIDLTMVNPRLEPNLALYPVLLALVTLNLTAQTRLGGGKGACSALPNVRNARLERNKPLTKSW